MKAEINIINIDVSNETIGEIITIVPYLFDPIKNNIQFIVGNFISEIKASCLSIFDTYKELKSKWKFAKLLQENTKEYAKDTLEMVYIKSKYDQVVEESK